MTDGVLVDTRPAQQGNFQRPEQYQPGAVRLVERSVNAKETVDRMFHKSALAHTGTL